jgi:hypothetical protein
MTSKQKPPETIGREFAQAIDAVFLSLTRAGYAESLRILRGIEAKHVAQLTNYPEIALELRRRTAEQSLIQALMHGCSQSECRKKLGRAEQLGWSIIDQKLHFHLIYARGMVARGHDRTARRIAKLRIADVNQELDRIEQLPTRRGRKYFLGWLKFFNEIITETERSGLKGYSSRWDAGGAFVRNHSQDHGSEASQFRKF